MPEAAFGLCHRAPEFISFASHRSLVPPPAFSDAFQSLALALGGCALTFVRQALPLICRRLALIGDTVTFVSNSISIVSGMLTTIQLILTP